MTKDEALTLALEALENASTGNRRPEIIGPAITAAKEALAQPEQKPVGFAVMERPWVGLTDEELLDIADMAYANDLELLHNLQAKLKEKNT